MIASFSPTELDFTAAINSTGPIGDDLDLIDPIPLPVSFPQAVHSDPAPQETVMTAAVEPAAGPFQIRDLILFDVGFVSIFDPDVGRVIRFKALTFAGSQDGPGSIQITAGQVLLVRVVYHAGPVATTETAQLVITTAEADRATIQLSLTTFVPPPLSIVETALSADHFPIVVGGRAQLSVTVRSLSGPATDVSFEKSEKGHRYVAIPSRPRCHAWHLRPRHPTVRPDSSESSALPRHPRNSACRAATTRPRGRRQY